MRHGRLNAVEKKPSTVAIEKLLQNDMDYMRQHLGLALPEHHPASPRMMPPHAIADSHICKLEEAARLEKSMRQNVESQIVILNSKMAMLHSDMVKVTRVVSSLSQCTVGLVCACSSYLGKPSEPLDPVVLQSLLDYLSPIRNVSPDINALWGHLKFRGCIDLSNYAMLAPPPEIVPCTSIPSSSSSALVGQSGSRESWYLDVIFTSVPVAQYIDMDALASDIVVCVSEYLRIARARVSIEGFQRFPSKVAVSVALRSTDDLTAKHATEALMELVGIDPTKTNARLFDSKLCKYLHSEFKMTSNVVLSPVGLAKDYVARIRTMKASVDACKLQCLKAERLELETTSQAGTIEKLSAQLLESMSELSQLRGSPKGARKMEMSFNINVRGGDSDKGGVAGSRPETQRNGNSDPSFDKRQLELLTKYEETMKRLKASEDSLKADLAREQAESAALRDQLFVLQHTAVAPAKMDELTVQHLDEMGQLKEKLRMQSERADRLQSFLDQASSPTRGTKHDLQHALAMANAANMEHVTTIHALEAEISKLRSRGDQSPIGDQSARAAQPARADVPITQSARSNDKSTPKADPSAPINGSGAIVAATDQAIPAQAIAPSPKASIQVSDFQYMVVAVSGLNKPVPNSGWGKEGFSLAILDKDSPTKQLIGETRITSNAKWADQPVVIKFASGRSSVQAVFQLVTIWFTREGEPCRKSILAESLPIELRSTDSIKDSAISLGEDLKLNLDYVLFALDQAKVAEIVGESTSQ